MIKNILQIKNPSMGKKINSNEKPPTIHKTRKTNLDPWKAILENGTGCILSPIDENWEEAWIRYYAGMK